MIFKSGKQRRIEKEQKATAEKAGKIQSLKWLTVVCLLLPALGTAPSVAMLLFIILAVVMVPVPYVQQLWSRIPVKRKWFKPAVLIVGFFIAACLMPDTASESTGSAPEVSLFSVTDTVVETETEASGASEASVLQETSVEETVLTEEAAETSTETEQTAETEVTADTEPVMKTEAEDVIKESAAVVSSAPITAFTDIPEYPGKAYVTVNGNVPFFTDDEITAVSYEYYSNLDALGRCGVCSASVGQDIMPTEERGSIGSVRPSGWHTVKYSGIIADNYLYNRCHLIGYQLSGENDNVKNLITGTRYMNMEGMRPFEDRVADYVKSTGNHVMYRVTPIFEGDNPVASGVLMEAESVEDNGEGILFNVFCFNVQPGIRIIYSDGSSEPDGTVAVQTETVMETVSVPAETPVTQSGNYAVNGKNGKIHITQGCPATGNGDSSMKQPVYFDTYEEAEAYSVQTAPNQEKRKCGNCW